MALVIGEFRHGVPSKGLPPFSHLGRVYGLVARFNPDSVACAELSRKMRVCAKCAGAASLYAVRVAFKGLPDSLRRYRPRLPLHTPLEP